MTLGRRIRLLSLVLAVGLARPSLAWAAPTASEDDIIHVVRPGDTLGVLAQSYGVSLQDIIFANDLADPDLILDGQRLLIPLARKLGEADWPAPITDFSCSTLAPAQGQTWTVTISSSMPLTPSGTFDGHVLRWVGEQLTEGEGWRYWALAGVHPLTEPGPHELAIETADALGAQWTTVKDIYVQPTAFDTEQIYLSAATSALLAPDLVQRELEQLAAIWSQGVAEPAWQGTFARPVHPVWWVSSPYGQRRAYNEGPISGYHAGTDFGASQGALVRAPAAGKVVLAESLTVRGNAVVLDHGAGVHSGYWHLWQILVQEGEQVEQGQPLGRVGTTGLSTGAHLHWELRVGDVAVDPLQWTDELMPQLSGVQ